MGGKFLGMSGSNLHVETNEGPKLFEVDKNVVVTRNGAPAKLSDIRRDDVVDLSGQPSVTIVAKGA